jgi:hypothetical protein
LVASDFGRHVQFSSKVTEDFVFFGCGGNNSAASLSRTITAAILRTLATL